MEHVTKPGLHGTLRLYEIVYFDPNDVGFGEGGSRVWGYDAEHAIERFLDNAEFQGGGWAVARIAAVRTDVPHHRWNWMSIDR